MAVFAATAVIAGTGQVAVAATAPQYQLILGPADARQYIGINSRGDILGTGDEPGAKANPEGMVLKAGTAKLAFLAGPGDPTNSFTVVFPKGINNNGQAVGYRLATLRLVNGKTDITNRPLQWPGGGGTVGVDVGADRDANVNVHANAINDNGLVVGASDGVHTTPWQVQNGRQTNLPTLAGGAAEPFAVNNDGVIVGNANDADHNVVATQWRNGQIVSLGALPGGGWAVGAAINSSGLVVGASTVVGGGFGTRHAVVFANGTVTDLNPPGTGRDDSIAYAVNDSGVIVGQAGNGDAFIYRDGQAIDLNTLIPANSGIRLTSARGINNNGQIVGQAVVTTNGPNSRTKVPFELTPM
ncbi:DUF3466 family protein [Actinocrispum wychmicini]|uniref:DUF3466 family protein n=1 Tax=Actinocrispum wychmicini TaxID=1213861 RepID=UPI001048C935|nr:DUF3466 family protein [Actinocrispum wychmicini]